MSNLALVSEDGQKLETFKRDDLPIAVHGLTVNYGTTPAIFSIDVSIPAGSLTGIIGPNGAGKSTFLKALMSIEQPVSGHITFHNQALRDVRDKIAYVPQRADVDWDFPASVSDVVGMGLYSKMGLWGRMGKSAKQKINGALEKVGLTHFADRQIGQLSGGQQQRVFLARALVQDAEIYLFDEPFAGVDAATENSIIEILKELQDSGKTILVVHHDLHTVTEYFDHALLLNKRLISFGPTQDSFTKDYLAKTYGKPIDPLNREHVI